jgi:hypothetical protein
VTWYGNPDNKTDVIINRFSTDTSRPNHGHYSFSEAFDSQVKTMHFRTISLAAPATTTHLLEYQLVVLWFTRGLQQSG